MMVGQITILKWHVENCIIVQLFHGVLARDVTIIIVFI